MSDVRQPPPPEPPVGQDDAPPVLGLLLAVVGRLLDDLDAYLYDFEGDPGDLRTRIGAVRRLLVRADERGVQGGR